MSSLVKINRKKNSHNITVTGNMLAIWVNNEHHFVIYNYGGGVTLYHLVGYLIISIGCKYKK